MSIRIRVILTTLAGEAALSLVERKFAPDDNIQEPTR